MIRSAASKVMWVGRATVFMVGLSVILALVFGVATSAMGANGKPFLLGKRNVASAISTLVKQGTGPALKLQVGAGQPPMAVNSTTKVARLNADRIDDREAASFANGVGGVATNADKLDSLDSADFQRRVSGQCAEGSSIRSIGADGTTLACEQDDDLSGDQAFGDLSGNYPNPFIANGAVSGGSGGKIVDGTINQADISDSGGVSGGSSNEVVNGSINADDIAMSGVGSSEVADRSLRVQDIAATSVIRAHDGGSIPAGACATTYFANSTLVNNGDLPILIPPSNLTDGLVANSAPVSSGWTTLRICNVSNAAIDPPSLTFTFVMLRP